MFVCSLRWPHAAVTNPKGQFLLLFRRSPLIHLFKIHYRKLDNVVIFFLSYRNNHVLITGIAYCVVCGAIDGIFLKYYFHTPHHTPLLFAHSVYFLFFFIGKLYL